MVLMAIDHSSDAFNAGRLFTDSARIYHAGSPLPAAQFLTRWITHICAPTFLFLAGTSLAFTVSRQVAAGDRPRDIDRYVLVRGLVIALFELWISFTVIGHGRLVLQVLYGIGTSYMLMAPLRRLPDRAAPIVALGFIATSELLVRWATSAQVADTWPVSLLLTGGFRGRVIVAYPTLHWLAILLLGWSWGRRLVTAPASRQTAARDATRAGLVGSGDLRGAACGEWLRQHAVAARIVGAGPVAARQQVPAVDHVRRAGAGTDGADPGRAVSPG